MEAKYRLQTNDENWHQIWKEDGEGRELPYCEIVNTDKETVAEVFRAVNTFDQARELLDAIQVICDDPQTSYHIPGVLMDRLIALQAAMEATP